MRRLGSLAAAAMAAASMSLRITAPPDHLMRGTKWRVKPSKLYRQNGKQECERRKRQIECGQLRKENGLSE